VREILAQKDTSIYQIRNEKLVGKSRAYALVDLSIFHMALTVQLNNYGLDKAGYHLENVKSDKGLILTKWAPLRKPKIIWVKSWYQLKKSNYTALFF
jgi:hypothetical protein